MNFKTNREKGNFGLAMAIAYFSSKGYSVSIPLNDTQDYDLVVDIDGTLNKIQCKATGTISKNNSDSYDLSLRTVGGNGKVYYTAKDGNFDLLFCLRSDMIMYLIPRSEINTTAILRLTTKPNKYSNKRMIKAFDYIISM